ncbi:hypothetical protein EVG20_g4259 [Dentipellis fragilis]|uniref:DUF659 domain-containing protein n=1 Tax=Dentipellis fragilis TaxID=205917 RepID=A0A4Y9YX63_9AGAM|nr:hypothetical protein EVG20_g4259 [Dentipellis fragilis]
MTREHAVWEYFKKGKNNYRTDGTHKEAWCHGCITAQALSIHASEVDAERKSMETMTARDEDEIRESLYMSSTALCGKVDMLLTHLRKKCPNVHPHIRDWAQNTYHTRKFREAKKQVRAYSEGYALSPSSSPSQSQSSSSESSISRLATTFSSRASLSSKLRPRKTRRIGLDLDVVDEDTLSDGVKIERMPPSAGPPWPEWYQAEFAIDLCRLFLVANIAWWALDIPFVRRFFRKYVSRARLPGRKELSGRVLEEEVKKVTGGIKAKVDGLYATGQCDGWQNISKDHILATMVNAEYLTYLIHTFRITKERKTAENLLAIVLEQIKFYTQVLGVVVIAWCTDASGEAAKMRRLLVQCMPELVVVDCWAHQMNLVTGDILKHAAIKFKVALDDALEIVKWFNSHTRALGMLKDVMVQKFGRSLCLILPVMTRWTSHYLAVRRLLVVQRAFLQLLLDGKENDLVLAAGAKDDARAKAREIIKKLKRPGFFEDLKEYVLIAALILITIANLYRLFSNPKYDGSIRCAVLRSLEKRWGKQDQGIFILAVVLNPFIWVSAFAAKSPFRQPDIIQDLATKAFKRFFYLEPDDEFMTAIMNYLHKLGPWSDAAMGLARFKKAAKDQGLAHVNLINVWRNKIPIRDGLPPFPPLNGNAGLANLALRIASIVPNTASTERTFSQFKIIHSALRNRLSHEKVRKQTLIREDVMRMDPMPPHGEKRKFGEESKLSGSDEDSFNSILACGFSDIIQNLVEDSEQDDTLPGALYEDSNLSNTPPSASSGQQTSSPEPLHLRIRIPPELRDKQALMLRFLFPRSEETSPVTASIFADFWDSGEQTLESEEKIQEMINEPNGASSIGPIVLQPETHHS